MPRQFLFPGGVPAAGSDSPSCGWYLLTDGYSDYNALALEMGILGHAACWAHVRRKLVQAAEGRKSTAAAHQVVALIGKLYAVERELYDRSSAERKAAREDRSRPILDKIKAWLDEDALLPHRDGQGQCSGARRLPQIPVSAIARGENARGNRRALAPEAQAGKSETIGSIR